MSLYACLTALVDSKRSATAGGDTKICRMRKLRSTMIYRQNGRYFKICQKISSEVTRWLFPFLLFLARRTFLRRWLRSGAEALLRPLARFACDLLHGRCSFDGGGRCSYDAGFRERVVFRFPKERVGCRKPAGEGLYAGWRDEQRVLEPMLALLLWTLNFSRI